MRVKRIFIVLMSAIYSQALYAEYDVANLHKLFTDKKQRVQIDAKRSGKSMDPEVQKTDKVSVSGYVTRTNGQSVVWVNNKNTLDKTRLGNIRVDQANIGKNKKVGLTVDGKRVHLKPGESWTEGSGVSDSAK